MSHHAYFVAGDNARAVEAALAFAQNELGLETKGNPDVIVLHYSMFPVEEARKIADIASRAALGGKGKCIIIATDRIFHEAQNALLKTFEEPSEGTTLILIVSSEGVLIPTLRSRLLPLPGMRLSDESEIAREFLATPAARSKVVERILDRAKSDKDEEKQAGRREARELVEGLVRAAYAARRKTPSPDLDAFLSDLDRFIPILHERSAPLKPILEHVLITTP